jgi:hypothetical protein
VTGVEQKRLISRWASKLCASTGCTRATARVHVRRALGLPPKVNRAYTAKFKLGDRIRNVKTGRKGKVIEVIPEMRRADTNVSCNPYRVNYVNWLTVFEPEEELELE